MASPITKQTLEHLARLARIELDPREEEKLIKDLEKILDHFRELEGLDTKDVPPMSGGTRHNNTFREDAGESKTNDRGGGEAFPENEQGFLKVPPVFPAEGGSASGGE